MSKKSKRPEREPIMIKVHTEALATWLGRVPPDDQWAAGKMHRDFEIALKRTLKENPDNQEGIAAGMFDVIDKGVEKQLAGKYGQDVKCKRGCSACCRLHVTISEAEAKLIRIAADEIKWPIDADRLKVQAQAASVEQWRDLPPDARACVFLTKAGECAIYEYRPGACRKYLVITDPADCDSVAKPGHRVGFLMAPEAEIAFSASLSVFKSGTLAAMLLAEMGRA